MWHVWNVCPSIQAMRVIVSGGRRKGSMWLSPCTHTRAHKHMHKQIVFECVFWLCLWALWPQVIVKKKKRVGGFVFKWSASWSVLLFWLHENPSSRMVLVSLIHRRTETHSNGLKFKTLFSNSLAPLFLVLHSGAPAPALPLPRLPLLIHPVPGTPHSFIFY